ncbi:hypothetical protein DAETH_48060 (plasmid) [Deinococcus aetherius]|uniref:Phage tail tape measure protein domain-containing protein n=2 Tax=Deinococcus aetherius TaxID=200252 RepID=A0ABM8AM48_9DEIO|nr:hypothetical protein DAETH_48060 [Deinococcus aetherius]
MLGNLSRPLKIQFEQGGRSNPIRDSLKETEQAASETQRRIDALFQRSGDSARASAESIRQGLREQAEEARRVSREQAAATREAAQVARQETQQQAQAARQALREQASEARRVSREQAAAAREVDRATRLAAQQQAQAVKQSLREQAAEATRVAREQATAAREAERNAKQQAQAEKALQQALQETIRSLDAEQRSIRNLWQAGRVLGPELVQAQRDIQERALVATAALDKQSDAYRRLTQVAAAAQRTQDQATGRVTPGGFSAGVVSGIQNSGLFNQLAANAGLANTAQNLGIVSQAFTGAKKSAVEFGGATNAAAITTGVMSAAGAGLALGLGAVATGFLSLGRVGLEQTKTLQGGLNTLQANGLRDLDGFQKQVRSLKEELGTVGKSLSVASLTATAADLVKANLSASDSLTVLAASSKLAAAENTNLNQTSAQLLMNVRQYGLGVEQAGRVADMFAKAGNLAAGTANDLSLGFGKVGGTGLQAGIAMNDLLGMLVELDLKGMSAADVGADALRTALSSLADPSEKAKGILKGLGVQIDDTSGKARPAGAIMADLGEKMRGMGITFNAATGQLEGNGEALRTVAGLMDTRAAAAVISLTGEWRKHGQVIQESAGYATEYADIMNQGVEPAQRRLNTALEDAGLALVKSFAGPLANLLDKVITPGIETLGKFVEKLEGVRSPGELKASLKITAEDSNTVAVLKLLTGAGVALSTGTDGKGGVAGMAAGAQKQIDDLVRAFNVAQLQGALVQAGVLERQFNPLKQLAQARAIGADVPKYQQLLADALNKNTQASQALLRGLQPQTGTGSPSMSTGVAGLWTANTIAALKDVFVNDPRVSSDCAIIASRILQTIGVSIKPSANAAQLERNAVAAGAQRVGVQGANTGDLVVYSSGNGRKYGATSGKHVAVVVGRDKKGNLLIIENPGSSNTQVVPIYDTQNAAVYRFKESPISASSPAGRYGTAGASAPSPVAPADPNAGLKKALDQGYHLINQYRAALRSGGEVWQTKAKAALDEFLKNNRAAVGGLKDDLASLSRLTSGRTTARSGYGQGYDRLKGQLGEAESLYKLSDDARGYVKSLDAIAVAAHRAADAEENKNGKTRKYYALLGLAGDATGKARSQRDALQRDEDQADREGERRAREAQGRRARVAEAARQGNITLAEQELDRLQQMRENDLRAVGKNAEARVAVERRYAGQIYAAQVAVAERRRKDALADAANGPAQERAQAETVAQNAYTATVTKAAADRDARLQQVEEESEERRKARQQQTQAVIQAGRQLDVQLAQAHLKKLEGLRDADLKKAGDNAAQRVAVEKRYAQGVRAAQESIAQAQYTVAERAALSGPAQNREDALRLAREERDAALRAAASTTRVDDAIEQQAVKVRSLRDSYHQLAESVREKVEAGTFDEQAQQDATRQFNELGRAAREAGLYHDQYAEGARKSTWEAIQGGRAAQEYQGHLRDLDGQLEASEAAQTGAAQRAADLASSLDDLGDRAGALATLNAALDAVMEAAGRGENVGQAVSFLTGEIDGLSASLDRGALERAQNFLANVRAEQDTRADEVATTAEQAQGSRDQADAGRVAGLAKAGVFGLTNFLGGAANSFFGERFWTQLGEQGRERFRAELDMLTPADFAKLGETALRGLSDRIGDAPEWADLKAKVNAGITMALENGATDAGYQDLNMLLTQFEGLDAGASDYADTLRDGLLPELKRIRDTATDPALKDMADRAITRLEGEVDAARSLADALQEAKQAQLDRDKAAGRVSEAEYIDRRTGILASAEIARYARESQGLTGAAALAAQVQYQERLGAIYADGDRQRQDLTLRIQDETLAVQRQREVDELEDRHQRGLISETNYLQARQVQAEQAARDEFARRVRGLKEGSEEYRAAEKKLQADLTAIRQQGERDRASGLKAAQDELTAATREYAQAIGETERPYQTQIANLELLKQKYPELASGIDQLIGKYRELQAAADFGPLASSLGAAAGILGKNGPLNATISAGLSGLEAFFSAGGKAGGRGAILMGAAAFVGGLVDVFKTGDEDVDAVVGTLVSGLQATLMQLAQGNWVGALLTGVATLVGTVIDLFRGGRNSARKAAREIADATKDVKFFDVSKYAKVVSRGGFLGFLGFKKAELDEEAVSFAKTLGDAIYEAIQGGMLDGIKAGKTSFTALGLDLKKSLAQNILQGLIDGFLKGEVMKNIIQPFLDRFIAAKKTADPRDDVQAAADLQQAVVSGNAEMADFYNNVLVPTSKQLGVFGVDAETGTETGSSLGGNAATDLGLASAPTGVVAAPDWAAPLNAALPPFTRALVAVTPLLERLTDEGIGVNAVSSVVVRASSDLRAYATR